jgi:heme a synthase
VSSAVGPVTRRIFLAGIVAQAGIVVTGGLVRLTGSGLGCPSWPECVPGSYRPVPEQAEGYHVYVEYGNRLLTFVVTVVVAACVVAAWRHRPRRRPLVVLAGAQVLGVLGQAVLGGITVLTELHPATVAAHFLLSMVLLAVAVTLYERGNETGDGPPVPVVRAELHWLGRGLTGLAALVLVLGTVVTGSGPHSGDADAPARFGLDPKTMSWLHADVVLLFLGVTIALLLALRLTEAPPQVTRRTLLLLGVALGQGTIGYVQYFTGLPELVVAAHLLGACLVWIATVRLVLSLRTRSPSGRVLLHTDRPLTVPR